jgi:uncharacterized protein
MKIIKFSIFLIFLIIFLYLENNLITVTHIEFESNEVPEGFNGYRIVHLSDLHNKVFGKGNNNLITKLKKTKPDLIAITGDLIDINRYDDKVIIKLLDDIKVIAPVYYVIGNHEVNCPQFINLEKTLISAGIHILRNEASAINLNNNKIAILGIDDPGYPYVSNNHINQKLLKDELDKVVTSSMDSDFKILLSHRPEHFSLYTEYNIDLVFSGHAHGGQIRLPFIGGIIGTGQNFPLKYTSGKYDYLNSSMVVSRGLGNGSIPQRLFNRPEIIVVTLQKT